MMVDNYMVYNLADSPEMNPVEMEDCNRCGGQGWTWIGGQVEGVDLGEQIDCPKCKGTGQIPKIAFTIDEEGV